MSAFMTATSSATCAAMPSQHRAHEMARAWWPARARRRSPWRRIATTARPVRPAPGRRARRHCRLLATASSSRADDDQAELGEPAHRRGRGVDLAVEAVRRALRVRQATDVVRPFAERGAGSPVLASRNAPVPKVHLALPTSRQPSASSAACWSTMKPATGTSPTEGVVVPTISSQETRRGSRSPPSPNRRPAARRPSRLRRVRGSASGWRWWRR